jgi:RNA polymerase sigma-70 factor (ECF subfamily)
VTVRGLGQSGGWARPGNGHAPTSALAGDGAWDGGLQIAGAIGAPCLAATVARMDGVAITDEELMLRYAGGEAGAFETLYSRHRGGLYRFIKRQCGDPGVAEEMYQEVWESVISSRDRYRVEARFRTWLYTLAHHRVIDWYRKSSRVVWVDFGKDDESEFDAPAGREWRPDVRAESRQIAQRLLELIAELPPPQREAFLLHEEGGLSVEDIAVATGAGVEAAKSRLRYALAKLKRGLREVV